MQSPRYNNSNSSNLPSLINLFAAATLSIGAPSSKSTKRKALPSSSASNASSTTASNRVGHFGLSNDSSASIALVALSRLMQSRDDGVLQPAAQTPMGASMLSLLKAAVLRVATSVGGADAGFNELTATSLWNLSASVVANQRLYDGGFRYPPGQGCELSGLRHTS